MIRQQHSSHIMLDSPYHHVTLRHRPPAPAPRPPRCADLSIPYKKLYGSQSPIQLLSFPTISTFNHAGYLPSHRRARPAPPQSAIGSNHPEHRTISFLIQHHTRKHSQTMEFTHHAHFQSTTHLPNDSTTFNPPYSTLLDHPIPQTNGRSSNRRTPRPIRNRQRRIRNCDRQHRWSNDLCRL